MSGSSSMNLSQENSYVAFRGKSEGRRPVRRTCCSCYYTKME